MRKHATLVHLNALRHVNPLVGGYLKAFAYADPEIRRDWDIELHSTYVRAPASEIIRELFMRAPDVIGFSVYCWNVGLVMRLLSALRGLLPRETQFILGGVELMHGAHKFLDPTWENVTVCNGEGEQSFLDFLVEAQSASPGLERVRGISYARDGQWRTTEDLPRIRDLSTIPSPWLEGMFVPEDMSEVALLETNRGCPFACEFCYWGGAVGERVNKLEVDRLKEEIAYIARHKTRNLVVCDANFGMLRRDLDLAAHVADMKRLYRSPSRIVYSSAKNSPERVEQVARIFHQAGMLQNHSISLQTLNERALSLAKRDNIKKDTYIRLQRRLNEWGVPSYVELIWPLPGETLDSFKDGVNQLCSTGAQSFTIYPLLWLNNVGYAQHAEEYGVATLQEDDSVGGGRVVIKTTEVPFADYLEGLQHALSVYLLHNCRGLYTTMLILNALGVASFKQVFDDFTAMMNCTRDDNAIVRVWHDGKAHFEEMIKYTWLGAVAYTVLHSNRKDFDHVLETFIGEHADWMQGEHARLLRAAFDFDLLTRPFPYLQTPFEIEAELRELAIRKRQRGIWHVESPFDFPGMLHELRSHGTITLDRLTERPVHISINHRCRQTFQLPGKHDEEHHWHMHQSVREIRNLEPACKVEATHTASTT